MFGLVRQMFHASDGGNLALDWLLSSDGNLFYLHHNIAIIDLQFTPGSCV